MRERLDCAMLQVRGKINCIAQEQNSNETVYKQERNILVEINKLYVCIDIGKSNLLGMLLLYPTVFLKNFE